MSYKEVGKVIRALRNGEKVICPKCHKGVVKSVGDPKITHGFHCEKCDFKIHFD